MSCFACCLVLMEALQSPHTESTAEILWQGVRGIVRLAAGNAVNKVQLRELGACSGVNSISLQLFLVLVDSSSAVAAAILVMIIILVFNTHSLGNCYLLYPTITVLVICYVLYCSGGCSGSIFDCTGRRSEDGLVGGGHSLQSKFG